jgi:MYXO-CTERM domain-containing protein
MRLAALVSIGLLGLLAPAAPAHAHIALTSPAARTAEQKTGPCGIAGSTRGANVTHYQPGQTITVEWDETVDHPGHYRLSFDDDGNDSFQNPVLPEDAFPQTLVDQIPDRTGAGHYSQQVTLPNIACTNCTLQLVQIMTTTVPYSSFYFQCADLVLGDDPGPSPGDSGGGCAAGSSAPGLAAGLAALGLLGLVRRRHGR